MLRNVLSAIAARRRAVSLIEGVLYMVIALAVLIGGIVFFNHARLASQVTDTARTAVGISTQARSLYQRQPSFGENEDLTRLLIMSGAVPENFVDETGSRITHPFGGDVVVTGNGKVLVLSYIDISEAACIRLANFSDGGVGPMGIGIVGMTISNGEPIDPTSSPQMTGSVAADRVAASCADEAALAVYYSQFADARPAATEPEPEDDRPLNSDNPWNYPFPETALYDACRDKKTWKKDAEGWEVCLNAWGDYHYGRGDEHADMCGPQPSGGDWNKEPEHWRLMLDKAKQAWQDCHTYWNSQKDL
jgi:hypothetical protein